MVSLGVEKGVRVEIEGSGVSGTMSVRMGCEWKKDDGM